MPSQEVVNRCASPPLVSIVTPSLNQGRFIRDTIESVLMQDYRHLEYFVIDGGSNDGTVAILREYEDRLDWVSEPDHGQSHAVNKGLDRADGEIFGWLNSDDVLLPGAVSAAVEAFQTDPAAAIVYGDNCVIDIDGHTLRVVRHGDFDWRTFLNLYDYIPQPAAFLRRSVLDDIGALDEQLNFCMDLDVFLRIAAHYPVVHVSEPLAGMRDHAETKSQTGGYRRYREVVRVLRRHSRSRFPPGLFAVAFDMSRYSLHRWIMRRTPRRAQPAMVRLLHWAGTPVRLFTRRQRTRQRGAPPS